MLRRDQMMLNFLISRDKDIIQNTVRHAIERAKLFKVNDIQFVQYDLTGSQGGQEPEVPVDHP